MKKYFEILRKCRLFYDIADDDIAAMLACLGAFTRKYEKNQMIITEGDEARYVGVLLCGTAQIEQTDYYGNRSIVASIEPSEIFGETFACAGSKHMPIDVVAYDRSEVMFIDCAKITRTCSGTCSHHQQIIYNLMHIMAKKNLMFRQRIEITSKRTTREKLMAYLLAQAKNVGKNSFDIPYDRQQLADYLAVDRSGLSAEISKLRREGVIKCVKNRFTLI